MAQKSDSALNTQALIIKNETVNDANTADRIGTMYVDIISSKINNDQIGVTVAALAGPAFTGTPTAPTASPGTNSTQLATTAYADTGLALRLLKSGDTMTGNLAMSNNKVTGLAAASANGEAVRYEQITPLATLASPAFTGTPTAPTQSALDNSTKLATTAYVDTAVATATPNGTASVRGLNRLYTATGSNTDGSMDQNSTTLALNLRLLLAGGTMSGNIAMGGNKVTGLAAAASPGEAVRYEQITPLATLASPALTGTPTAPTASPGTNSTQVATTAYTDAAAGLRVLKAGDTMSGNLAMGTNKVTGLGAASANGDAVRFEQVISAFAVLTDGSGVTWDMNNSQTPQAQLTTTNTSITFTLNNVKVGAQGVLKLITSTASAITINLPAGLTHKRFNTTFSSFTFPAATGKEYYLSFKVSAGSPNIIEWDIPVYAPKIIQLAASDETTPLTTGVNKFTFRMPYAMVITDIRASLTAAQTSGSILTVDVNESGSTILGTKLTIDNNEKTSVTAATPPAFSDVNLAEDAEITIDIDQIGNGTAAGLKITLYGV